jgi:hypothetical protein
MVEKNYKYQIEFGIKDISENPNSSLSTKCIKILLEQENPTIPEWFVIEKNIKYQKVAKDRLWILFREMTKNLYNEKLYDKNNGLLTKVEEKRDRINFDTEFTLSIPNLNNASCRAQFKFSSGWEYITIILKTGSIHKPKIIKKTDQYWLDFFEMFSKNMSQEACFEEILYSLSRHAREIIQRN